MASIVPPQDAVDALLEPTAILGARTEIYEQDGATRWLGDTEDRLISGSVSIDYTRDERRTLDLVLDNYDDGLQNAPGRFWYDKVIKVFKSIALKPKASVDPFILISGDATSAANFHSALLTLGFTNAVVVAQDDLTVGALIAPDVSVIIAEDDGAGGSEIFTDLHSSLVQAYTQGAHILAIGSQAGIYGAAPNALASNSTLESTDPAANGGVVEFTPNTSAPYGLGEGWSGFSSTFTGSMYVTDDPFAAIPIAQRIIYTYGNGSQYTWGPVLGWTGDSGVGWTGVPTARWVRITPPLDYDNANYMKMIEVVTNWLVNSGTNASTSWEIQIGEFMIDNISEDDHPRQTKVTGRDYTKKCLNSKFTQAVEFDGPISLELLIAELAANCGITKMALPPTGVTIEGKFTYERNSPRWAAMKALANAYQYDLYFDNTGYLQMTPYQDPTTTPPTFTFRVGPKIGNMASYTKSTDDSQLFNHISVIGATDDESRLTPWAEAKDTDADSPTNIDEIGDRLYEYDNDFIVTTEQAQSVANQLLASYSLEQFTLDFSAICMFFLDTGDIIRWVDPRPAIGDPDTFLLQTMTIPITFGPMQATAARLLSVV